MADVPLLEWESVKIEEVDLATDGESEALFSRFFQKKENLHDMDWIITDSEKWFLHDNCTLSGECELAWMGSRTTRSLSEAIYAEL